MTAKIKSKTKRYRQNNRSHSAFFLTLGIIIIIATFILINYFSEQTITTKLKKESSHLLDSINPENEENLFTNPDNYNLLRLTTGAQNNFCIYLEDENGNLLNLDGDIADVKSDQVGIGDSTLNHEENLIINGIPCGKPGQY